MTSGVEKFFDLGFQEVTTHLINPTGDFPKLTKG